MTEEVFLTSLTWLEEGGVRLHAPGCPELDLSPPPAFGGDSNKWTPEELLTGAIEACVLMTFLYFAKRQQIGLLRYTSHAEVRIEKTPDGLRFTEMSVTLEIGVASPADADKAAHAFERAKKYCPVSHALNFPVHIDWTVAIMEGKVPQLHHVNPYDELTTF